jgi:hypothetical protein
MTKARRSPNDGKCKRNLHGGGTARTEVEVAPAARQLDEEGLDLTQRSEFIRVRGSLIGCATLLTVALFIGGAQAAPVYKWTDENGMVHYSDQPHEGAQSVPIIRSPRISTVPAGATPGAAAERGAVIPANADRTPYGHELRILKSSAAGVAELAHCRFQFGRAKLNLGSLTTFTTMVRPTVGGVVQPVQIRAACAGTDRCIDYSMPDGSLRHEQQLMFEVSDDGIAVHEAFVNLIKLCGGGALKLN